MRVLISLAVLLLVLQFSLAAEVGEWNMPTSHAIGGIITFSNPTTLVINDFSYDGFGAEVYLYYYAVGTTPTGTGGTIIPLPEGGSDGRFVRGRSYNNERLVVPLPEGLTACNIGTLSIWCKPFTVDFSRVAIPRTIFLNNGMGECQLVGGNTDLPTVPPTTFENCESYAGDTIQVSWTVDRNNSEVDFQICSCRPLDASSNQYMAFGLSGSSTNTFMVGADATVAWVDNREGTPNAVDYFLTARVQCRSGEGVCPDTMVTRGGSQCSNDVRSGSIAGGIRSSNQQCVIFSRPLTTDDDSCDIDFDPDNMNQYIVWANGGLGETAFIHFQRSGSDSPPVHLGRTAEDRCASRPIMCAGCQPFIGKRMELPNDATLRVHIGPAGGERGYMGITGRAGWGISWYVNGTLIPELVVVRGRTYTFIVEGGTDDSDLSRYHPFYITDSIGGGRLRNTQEQRAMETVYAGFDSNDQATGVGRYCEFLENAAARSTRETCGNIEDYLSDLNAAEPTCDPGQPGRLTWTPTADTPDLLYYQCATHLNLGWRIVVQDVIGAQGSSAPLHVTLSTLSLLAMAGLWLAD